MTKGLPPVLQVKKYYPPDIKVVSGLKVRVRFFFHFHLSFTAGQVHPTLKKAGISMKKKLQDDSRGGWYLIKYHNLPRNIVLDHQETKGQKFREAKYIISKSLYRKYITYSVIFCQK